MNMQAHAHKYSHSCIHALKCTLSYTHLNRIYACYYTHRYYCRGMMYRGKNIKLSRLLTIVVYTQYLPLDLGVY